MSDNDILIDKSRAKDVKEIMKSLGYEVEAFGKGVHDEYVKKPVCFFEIHRALFNQNEKRLYEYYKDVEARLIKAEGTFERHFSIEDFYVYLLAHDYRHYSDSGTGLRSLLDIYLFWRKNGQRLDMNYTENQLATLGILDFEKQSRGLALRLFSGKELSEREEELLRYYILSGAHGSMLNEMKKQGRWQFFWKNLFLPFDRMTIQYPILRKLPFLLPVCWIMRFFRRLTRTPERIGQKLRYLLLYKEKEE